MAYVQKPESFDPSKASLRGYLVLSIDRDLRNILAKRRRRPNVTELPDDVELEAASGKDGIEAPTLEELLVADQLLARVRVHLAEPEDHLILDLLIDGERSTTAFAAILGLAEAAADEQRAAVKRCKDRIKAHLRRHWSEIDD
jgi:hypothetical protein